MDNDWLKSEFEHIGEITNARVQWDHDKNRSKGFGFVDFAEPALASKAVAEMNGKEIDGREINVDLAAGRTEKPREARARAFGDKVSDPSDTLFVGNLPFSANEDQIYEMFAEYGDVQSVRIPTDRESGAPKGFGYVSMGDVEQAKKAFEALSGKGEIEGVSLQVNLTILFSPCLQRRPFFTPSASPLINHRLHLSHTPILHDLPKSPLRCPSSTLYSQLLHQKLPHPPTSESYV